MYIYMYMYEIHVKIRTIYQFQPSNSRVATMIKARARSAQKALRYVIAAWSVSVWRGVLFRGFGVTRCIWWFLWWFNGGSMGFYGG